MKLRGLYIYSGCITMVLIILLMPYFSSDDPELSGEQVSGDFVIEYLDDYLVVFNDPVVEKLSSQYDPEGDEYYYCLKGHSTGSVIYVEELVEEPVFNATPDFLQYMNDPPCQFNGSLGSIHSHPYRYGCKPSDNDLFAFGEMMNPEPIINIIQCDYNEFYIMKMPGKQEGINYRSLRWATKD